MIKDWVTIFDVHIRQRLEHEKEKSSDLMERKALSDKGPSLSNRILGLYRSMPVQL